MKKLFTACLMILLLSLCACVPLCPEPEPEALRWKETYLDYLLNSFEIEYGYVSLGLADLDKNGVPELIVYDDSRGTMGGAVTIMTIREGAASRLACVGFSALFLTAGDEIWLYRDFDTLHTGGGMFGYGFISMLTTDNGALVCEEVIYAEVADYGLIDYVTSWDVLGEDVLHHASVAAREKQGGEWVDISADEYLQRKLYYLGPEPEGRTILDLPEFRYDCFGRDEIENGPVDLDPDGIRAYFDRFGS